MLLTWALLHFALNAHGWLSGFGPRLEDTLAEVLIYIAGAIIGYGQLLWLRRARNRSLRYRIGAMLWTTLVCSAIFTVVARVIWEALPPEFPMNPVEPAWVGRSLLFWSTVFGSCGAVIVAHSYSVDMRERERRLAEVEALARDAEMRALRYQVNPHFLYNTLSSISTLILDDRPQQADAMVMRLSYFLRASLATSAHDDIPLEEEVALQMLYLDIERLRFEERLEVAVDVPEDLGRALVPSLILQPLVENVIKHGLGPVGTVTRLSIRATKLAGRLVIEVANEGEGTVRGSGGTGVGLTNVRNRLAARFGGGQSFDVRPAPHGFTVRLSLPLRLAAA